VITDYYVDKIEDYLIVDPPTVGKLIAVQPGTDPIKLSES
jgi:hypothetical protein